MNNKIDFHGYSTFSRTDFQGELSVVGVFVLFFPFSNIIRIIL